MSCVGKTTFAQQLTNHTYYCFDALYPWHRIETLGLSIRAALEHVSKICTADRFVLDGWNLADPTGVYFPAGITVYVLYAPYKHIISQYRVPIFDTEEHRNMYFKWYTVNFDLFPQIRFFSNLGQFKETSKGEFQQLVSKDLCPY